MLAIRQKLRPDAVAVVTALRARGLDLHHSVGRSAGGGRAGRRGARHRELAAGLEPVEKIAVIDSSEGRRAAAS